MIATRGSQTPAFEPAYLRLARNGELQERARLAYERLSHCDVCAWGCGADRRGGKLGVCRTGERASVSGYGPHFGEEDVLRGWRGSGTIFFTRCNMRCQFCQNYETTYAKELQPLEPKQLASIMLELQELGCHNINLVSPSHVAPQIIAAVAIATRSGLHLPLVYNTGGYDSVSMLALLDGVIDIYMPDMKYASSQLALHYSKVRNYAAVNQACLREMHRQVGDLQVDAQGLAQRGLLVRHLVLPNHLAGTEHIVRFLATEISTSTYLNLMDQYRPEFNARLFPKLNRRLKPQEYQEAVQLAEAAGLHRLA